MIDAHAALLHRLFWYVAYASSLRNLDRTHPNMISRGKRCRLITLLTLSIIVVTFTTSSKSTAAS
jgi:hypothetical protein